MMIDKAIIEKANQMIEDSKLDAKAFYAKLRSKSN